ncbi:MAG: FAD:protein FMN transferase [Pedobacter sp.]|nr:MAG: FAD:protein FMN transferase [Pedobacter sp.]
MLKSIKLFFVGVFSLLLNTLFSFAQTQVNLHYIKGFAQGTSYNIQYYASSPFISKSNIDSILSEIDNSLSLYVPNSLINIFNDRNVISYDKHLKNVFVTSKNIYRKSEGIFNPSVAPLVKIWGFGPSQPNGRDIQDKQYPKPPINEQLKEALNFINFRSVKLQGTYLKKPTNKQQVDFNGIAQGYTVDVVYNYFKSLGVNSLMIELGGEIRVAGPKPNGDSFIVVIEGPPQYSGKQMVVKMVNGAITSSGIYQNGRYEDGKWISHIINAKLGIPVQSKIISATVYANEAILADALDQIFYTYSVDKAIRMAQRKFKIGLFLFYKDEDGNIQTISNRRFQKILIN